MADRVRKLAASDFDTQSDELLSARVASELVIAPLVLLEEDIQASTTDAKIDVTHDFNRGTNPFGPTYVDGLEVTHHLPFAGEAQLLRCLPSTFTLNGARALIDGRELQFPYDSSDRVYWQQSSGSGRTWTSSSNGLGGSTARCQSTTRSLNRRSASRLPPAALIFTACRLTSRH